jgi:hypothetical protein
MLVSMAKVQIVGRKPHVEEVVARLYAAGVLELSSAHEDPALELAPFPGETERVEHADELHRLAGQLDGLLALAGGAGEGRPPTEVPEASAVADELRALVPLVSPLTERIDALHT